MPIIGDYLADKRKKDISLAVQWAKMREERDALKAERDVLRMALETIVQQADTMHRTMVIPDADAFANWCLKLARETLAKTKGE